MVPKLYLSSLNLVVRTSRDVPTKVSHVRLYGETAETALVRNTGCACILPYHVITMKIHKYQVVICYSDDELRFMYENGQGHLTLFCIVFV